MNIQLNGTERETLIQVIRERIRSYPCHIKYQNKKESQIIEMSLV